MADFAYSFGLRVQGLGDFVYSFNFIKGLQRVLRTFAGFYKVSFSGFGTTSSLSSLSNYVWHNMSANLIRI